jgi:hypothetical protein
MIILKISPAIIKQDCRNKSKIPVNNVFRT